MKLPVKEQAGMTLIEIAVALVIIGILVLLAGPELSSTIGKARVEDCVKRLASDIKQARAKAQAEGQRAIVVVTKNSPQDFNRDGDNEHYLIFLDRNRNVAYETGDTVISEIACYSDITMEEAVTDPLPACTSIDNAQCLEFTSLGTIISDSTGGRIQMNYEAKGKNKKYKARIVVVSTVGYLQTQWCEEDQPEKCKQESEWHDY